MPDFTVFFYIEHSAYILFKIFAMISGLNDRANWIVDVCCLNKHGWLGFVFYLSCYFPDDEEVGTQKVANTWEDEDEDVPVSISYFQSLLC